MNLKENNFRNMYLYLVCLITIIIFIASFIFTGNNLVNIAFDDNYYETYQGYKERFRVRNEKELGSDFTISEEEMREAYDEYIELEKERTKNRNIKNLFSSVSAMLISGVFWWYHWRKIESKRNIA